VDETAHTQPLESVDPDDLVQARHRAVGEGTFGVRNTDAHGNLYRGPSKSSQRPVHESVLPLSGPAGDAAANFEDMGEAQNLGEAIGYGVLGAVNTAFAVADVVSLGTAAGARLALRQAGTEILYTGGKESAKHGGRVAAEAPVVRSSAGGLSLPKGGVRTPASRHHASTVTQRTLTKEANTVIDPSVNVAGDVEAINAGGATLDRSARGELTAAVNGRTYAVEPSGTLSPRTGEGFTTLGRGGFRALGILNKFGSTPQAWEIMHASGISVAAQAQGFAVWARFQ